MPASGAGQAGYYGFPAKVTDLKPGPEQVGHLGIFTQYFRSRLQLQRL